MHGMGVVHALGMEACVMPAAPLPPAASLEADPPDELDARMARRAR